MEASQKRSDGPIAEMDPVIVLGIVGSSLGLQVLRRDEFYEHADILEGLDDGIYYEQQDASIETPAGGLMSSAG